MHRSLFVSLPTQFISISPITPLHYSLIFFHSLPTRVANDLALMIGDDLGEFGFECFKFSQGSARVSR